jgi:multiple antibiotic resistance protein
MNWNGLLVAVVQLFVITDPIGNLPILYALTRKETAEQRSKDFLLAVLVAFSLLLLFALLGTGILSMFHITMPDFKIAGGLLLLSIAMLILVRGSWIESDGQPMRAMGAVPLGCPILVGPGAITTAMVLLGIYGLKVTLLAIFINFAISYVVLHNGERIFKLLGEAGSEIIARVMAIILAGMAIHYIRIGIEAVVIGLR